MCAIKNGALKIISKLIYPEGVNPLPMKLMFTLFFCNLFEAMTFTMAFSFLPKLVKSFGTPEVDVGHKVGILGSVLFVGRILTSYFWGYMADKYGRKRILATTVSCLLVSTLAFGFTFNFEWGVVTRLMQGLSMGAIVIAKALVTEVTDDTNSSYAIAIIFSAYSVGSIIGPSMGGFLAFPAELHPDVFSQESIFGKFGILLPSLLVSLGLMIGIIMVIQFVSNKIKKETDSSKKNCLFTDQTKNVDEETYLLAKFKDRKDTYEIKITKMTEYCYWSSNKSQRFIFKKTQFGKLIYNKTYMIVCSLYGVYSMVSSGLNEGFPLYAATSKAYNGFGFKPYDIGTALMVVSAAHLICQLTVIPRIINFFGSRKALAYTCIVQIFLYPLLPLIQKIENRYLFWTALLILLFLIRFFLAIGMISINVLVNNSVDKSLLGSANGFALTISNLGRGASTSILATLFGWSLTNIKEVHTNKTPLGFPFNQYFMFFLLSLLVLFTSICMFALRRSIDCKLVVDGNNDTNNRDS